ncbi:hypothetical protein T07_2147 [Trichinella nelsoni]|uniref:Uncharacterized protein n=1 Tax=Trichinella nelsoni TaxID=6336 RepID=A0A0V0RAS4_9BILA|nr:hypothetical protein T07_2147 [Trichinella nelsoni]
MGQKSQMHHHNDGMFFKTSQMDEFHQTDCIDLYCERDRP